MNDQSQRMLRIFFDGGYSDCMIEEDFNMKEEVEGLRARGYLIVANGDGYFPASEIKAMFLYRAANPPKEGGGNVLIFPKPVA